MKARVRIKIEEICEECGGIGRADFEDGSKVECSDCDGTGYTEKYIDIKELKKLIKEEG